MPRIRTIKPEFWTDSKIVRLSFESRLLFIGMWNFCDDEGYIMFDPLQIKMQVFPADPVDVESLIVTLIDSGLLAAFKTKDGDKCLQVKGFREHQRISKPQKSKIAPKVSATIPGTFRDRSALGAEHSGNVPQGKEGKERKGVEGKEGSGEEGKEGGASEFLDESIRESFRDWCAYRASMSNKLELDGITAEHVARDFLNEFQQHGAEHVNSAVHYSITKNCRNNSPYWDQRDKQKSDKDELREAWDRAY